MRIGSNLWEVASSGVTREGNKQVRFNSEPEASLVKRIQVTVLSWLPIEGLL